MPEGDTIHKLAAALRPGLLGRRLARAELRAHPGTPLAGACVTSVRALGKHLFIELDNGLTLRSHLGMHGSWHRYRPGEPWQKPERQASIVLAADEDVFVCFHAAEVDLLRSGGIRERSLANRLGPDLLAPHLDIDKIPARARELFDPDSPLVDILLDQRVAGGIGNVYKSEVLFLERHDPRLRLADVRDEDLRRLYATACELLRKNLHGGARTTRFVADGRGRLWVYGRTGLPCFRCRRRISSARLGKGLRSTYSCPTCQAEKTRLAP
jgi:endonuclease-8